MTSRQALKTHLSGHWLLQRRVTVFLVRSVQSRLLTYVLTPILRQLHWLPVWQRVQFKVAVLVFQCLSGNAPWQTNCQLITDISLSRLHSTDVAMFVARHSQQHIRWSMFHSGRMGTRRIFPAVGKLGAWGQKSPSGGPGMELRWRPGGEDSRSWRQVVKITHK